MEKYIGELVGLGNNIIIKVDNQMLEFNKKMFL